MRILKKTVTVFLIILALFFLFGVWYNYRYSMDEVTPYEINAPNNPTKLLIATQGSDFKNGITQSIIAHYKNQDIYIKVVDVTTILDTNTLHFDAILLMHTWEYGQPPSEVASFIGAVSPFHDRIIVVTTSGEGSYKMKNVDAITGESNVDTIPKTVDILIKRLNVLLFKERQASI